MTKGTATLALGLLVGGAGTVVGTVALALTQATSTSEVAAPLGLGAHATVEASSTPEASSAAPQSRQDFNAPYDGLYHFVRIQWDQGRSRFGWGRGGGPLWAHDYPRADFNFLSILQETTYVRSGDRASNVVRLDDPELFRHPIAYIVEIERWSPDEEDVAALGEYLMKGGFLIVDDFQGNRALQNLYTHLRRAVPGAELMRVEDDDPIFDSFFRIVPEHVIPPYGRYPPEWLGIYEDNDPDERLMVMINANNDIAEYWEYSDRGYYPIDLSNEAYKLGVNYVVYGLTR